MKLQRTLTSRGSVLYIARRQLEEATRMSLERKPPLILVHPQRLPNKIDFEELFVISEGQGLEHDVRAGKTGYSIQQGMWTDRLRAWTIIDTFEKFAEVFGGKRAREIADAVRERTKTTEVTIDLIRKNLFVKDLFTKEELQKFAALAGEEVLDLDQFLDIVRETHSRQTQPTMLLADIKDGDLTISGSPELAVQGTRTYWEAITSRGLNGAVFKIMQYNVPAIEDSVRLLGAGTTQIGAYLSSDRLKKDGIPAFVNDARQLSEAMPEDTRCLGFKIDELQHVQGVIRSNRVKEVVIYAPPDKSKDIPYLVGVLRENPEITALLIDA